MFKLRFVFIVILFTVWGLFTFLSGEKRVAPIPMEELTNPKSHYYVPHPYPKTREEIIDNLKSAVLKWETEMKQSHINQGTKKLISKNKMDSPKLPHEILLQIFEGKTSEYSIGEIGKVKNRIHTLAYDYYWLIFVKNTRNEIVVRQPMKAEGLIFFGISNLEKDPYLEKFPIIEFYNSEQNILQKLAVLLNKPLIKREETETMDRVAFTSEMAAPFAPIWEIRLKNGKLYYYDERTDKGYEIYERRRWVYSEEVIGLAPPSRNYLLDTINDEKIILKWPD